MQKRKILVVGIIILLIVPVLGLSKTFADNNEKNQNKNQIEEEETQNLSPTPQQEVNITTVARKNHGQYVSSVARGDGDNEEVKDAAKSDIGKKEKDNGEEDEETGEEEDDNVVSPSPTVSITPSPEPSVNPTETPPVTPTVTETTTVTPTLTPSPVLNQESESESESDNVVTITKNNIQKFFAMIEEYFNSLIK